MNKYHIAVLISGRGSNLVALNEAIKQGHAKAEIKCVISSSEKARGLDYAKQQGIATTWFAESVIQSEKAFSKALLDTFSLHRVRLVVLAGFLRKIPKSVIEIYRNRMINVHPALLPAFGGKGMYGRHVHEAVLEYGCKVSGATVHIVSAEYDTGPPILQECVPVLDDDTPESLAARILPVEHKLLPKAVDLFARDLIEVHGRSVRILR
ncbi:MAG: phosphoribosylglycinamide formyltransferase [bacterium]